MNFVLIMTDTQNKSMVGAYGDSSVDTPNLDRLAATGLRFENAYTACPLCTPARGALFSGLHPQVNGAWANNMAPAANVPLMGAIFRHAGYRAAYTGKWHLDGTGYFGDGIPGGGFEPDWWYDGKRYAEDLGPERFQAYKSARTSEDLRRTGFDRGMLWGHRVANRAIDFLAKVGDEPFLLVVSFDEPHGPYVAPPEYWEKFTPEGIPRPANYNAPLAGKPRLQQVQREQGHGDTSWQRFAPHLTRFFGCNSYIDREIGRVIEAVEQGHGDDTTIIYTSDHGNMMGAHGLVQKGPIMYQEVTNVPLIVRPPGRQAGATTEAVASHVDLIPTMLDLAGIERPEILHGASLAPLLIDPATQTREYALIGFHRFAINHDNWGEFYPIRCATDGRYKLAINLFETDEFYDLASDPLEMENRIADPDCAPERDRLHDWLLAEMDHIRDPFRSYQWGDRPWRTVRTQFYWGGERRDRPQDFAFQPSGIEAGAS